MSTVRLATLAFALAPSCLSAQEGFDAARFFPDEGAGRIRFVLDADGDTDSDLVWIGSHTVRVDLNDGTGDFTAGPLQTFVEEILPPFATPSIPPRAGDVDGDGDPDLVFGVTVFPPIQGKLLVLRGLPGAAFANPLTISLTIPPPTPSSNGELRAFALGNIDADPALEIAEAHDMTFLQGSVAPPRTDVTWWDWNGSAFTPSAPLALAAEYIAVQQLETLDSDSDGDADLVAAGADSTFSTWKIRVLPTASGTATLGAPFTSPQATRALRTGDLDGDGDEEFVALWIFGSPIAGADSIGLDAYQNHGGTFVLKSSVAEVDFNVLGFSVSALPTLADLDGDADLDVLYACESVAYLENDGANGFALAATFLIEPDHDVAGGECIAKDVDGDGLLDCIGPRAILRNPGPAGAIPADPPFNGMGVAGVEADWEGDGDSDVLGFLGHVATNDATGSYTNLASLYPSPLPGSNKMFSRVDAIGDFTGDGLRDFFVITFVDVAPFQLVYVGQTLMSDVGSGALGSFGVKIPPEVYPTLDAFDGGPRPGVDYDLDGDLDIAVRDGVLTNDGTGFAWTFVAGGFTSTDVVDSDDFDQDGDPDLLSRTDSATLAARTLHLQGAPLSFATQDVVVQPAPQLAHRALFLDVEGDGDLDIAAPGEDSTVGAWLVEHAGSSVLPAIPIAAAQGSDSSCVAASDVDGDGLLDLAIGRTPASFGEEEAAYLSIYRRTGPAFASLAPPRHWLTGQTSRLVDVDDDGDDDAISWTAIRNRLFAGADDGIIRQYGSGSQGTGGAIPVLGADGPVRVGSTTAELRVRRGRGGAPALLFVGLAEAALSGVVPGAKFYVQPPLVVVSLPLAGAAGKVGAGTLDVPVGPLIPTVAGLAIYHQLLVVDPQGPGGVAASQGLEIRYGF